MLTRKCLRIFGGIIILATLVPASSGADCGGKAFRCRDLMHFIICVDLGNGVSSTIDSFVIPCPTGTECRDTNNFECELPQNNTKANLMSTEVTTDTFSIEPTPTYELFPTTTENYEGNVQEREIYTNPSSVDTTVYPTTAQTAPSDVIIEVSSPADQQYASESQPTSENYGPELPSETTASASTTAESSATAAGSSDITAAESPDTIPAASTVATTEGSTGTSTPESHTVVTAEPPKMTGAGSSATTTAKSPAPTTDSTATSNDASAAGTSQDSINNAVDIITTPDFKGNEKTNGMSAQLIDDSHTTTEEVAETGAYGTDTSIDSTTNKNTAAVTPDSAVSSMRDGRTTTVQPDVQTAIDSNFYETTTPEAFSVPSDAINTVENPDTNKPHSSGKEKTSFTITGQTTQDNFMQFTEPPEITKFEESLKQGNGVTESIKPVTPLPNDVSGHDTSAYYKTGYPSTDPYPEGSLGVTPIMSTRMDPTTAGPSSEASAFETTTNTDVPIPTVIENPLENLILNSVNDNPNQNVILTSGHSKPENENPTEKPITSTMSVIPITDFKTTREDTSTMKVQTTKTNNIRPANHGNAMLQSHTEATKTDNHIDQSHSATGKDATTENNSNGQANTELVEKFMESTQTTQSGKLLAETSTEKLSPQIQNEENIESQNDKVRSDPYAVKGLASTVANKPIIRNVQTNNAKEIIYSEQSIVKDNSKQTNNLRSSQTTNTEKTVFIEKASTNDRPNNSNTLTTKNVAFASRKKPTQVYSNEGVVNQSQNKYAIIPLQSHIKPKDQGVTAVKNQNTITKGSYGVNEAHSTKTDSDHFKNNTGKIVIVKEMKLHETNNARNSNKTFVKNSHKKSGTSQDILRNKTITVDFNTQRTKSRANTKSTAGTNVNISKVRAQNENKTISYPTIDCKKLRRGRYSDPSDCRKFHICVGDRGPIHGTCPQKTVFSDVKKQCTKNLSECIRDDKFQCLKAGRFRQKRSDDVYYICAKNNLGGFVRYKLLCQKGYRLDKKTVKCISTEDKKSSESSEDEFICKEEGKFQAPGNCSKYYECYTKHKKLLTKTILCESDEIYHKKKKKCVDAESYECDTK